MAVNYIQTELKNPKGLGWKREWKPHNKERKNMAELRDEHFEVISKNKAVKYEKDKKQLQHQVMDLEMALHKIKEVIRQYENSNNNK